MAYTLASQAGMKLLQHDPLLESLLDRRPADDRSRKPLSGMLVFAHPDDETLALGSRLANLPGAHLIHLTDGAPRDGKDAHLHGFPSLAAYRQARQEELSAALAAADAPEISRECLEVPDQELAFSLVLFTRLLAGRIRHHRPGVIYTHPYEGGHPDHDACAFIVHHAVRAASRMLANAPLIVESPFYHLGANGIATGAFLPGYTHLASACHTLTQQELHRKQRQLACFHSQQDTLSLFSAEQELLRVAPSYDFNHPPHLGELFYDHFGWGLRSTEFSALARSAAALLERDTA